MSEQNTNTNNTNTEAKREKRGPKECIFDTLQSVSLATKILKGAQCAFEEKFPKEITSQPIFKFDAIGSGAVHIAFDEDTPLNEEGVRHFVRGLAILAITRGPMDSPLDLLKEKV